MSSPNYFNFTFSIFKSLSDGLQRPQLDLSISRLWPHPRRRPHGRVVVVCKFSCVQLWAQERCTPTWFYLLFWRGAIAHGHLFNESLRTKIFLPQAGKTSLIRQRRRTKQIDSLTIKYWSCTAKNITKIKLYNCMFYFLNVIQGSVVSGWGSALYWLLLVVNLARSGWLTKFTPNWPNLPQSDDSSNRSQKPLQEHPTNCGPHLPQLRAVS